MGLELPSHKSLGLSGIGELSIGDHTETSFAALQTPEFDLNGDTSLACALNIGLGNGDVLLVRLSDNHGQGGYFKLEEEVKRHTSAWLASTMIESKAMPCSARLRASSRCSGSVAWSRCTEIGTEAEWALNFIR